MKNILIINQYASTPDIGFSGRHYYLSEALSRLGYNVTLVIGGYTHLQRNPPPLTKSNLHTVNNNFSIFYLKLPRYKSPKSFQRVVNWFIFSIKAVYFCSKLKPKFDFVISSSPSLLPLISGYALSKYLSCKFIVDIRDIWPLTLLELGGYSKFHPFIIFNKMIERFSYKSSDAIISSIPGFPKYLDLYFPKIQIPFYYMPNGISSDEFSTPSPTSLNSSIDFPDIPSGNLIIGYVGTVGLANSLDVLLEAALSLIENNISIVIYGDGGHKTILTDKYEFLPNVYFRPSISKILVPDLLRCFDLLYLGWKPSKLYQFGISPQKAAEYMFSSKPILHSYSGSFDFVKKINCGFSVPADSPICLVEIIKYIKGLPSSELVLLGRNGFAYAHSNLMYTKIARDFSYNFLDKI
jgi:glycosyltransferase involved in cell wall biosynthesis